MNCCDVLTAQMLHAILIFFRTICQVKVSKRETTKYHGISNTDRSMRIESILIIHFTRSDKLWKNNKVFVKQF